MMQGCRRVDEFKKLNRINEGTYGVVYRTRDNKSGKMVALKKVKMERERDGFPMSALREINVLLSLQHPCIVNVRK
jgi:cell division cycle 2-like